MWMNKCSSCDLRMKLWKSFHNWFDICAGASWWRDHTCCRKFHYAERRMSSLYKVWLPLRIWRHSEHPWTFSPSRTWGSLLYLNLPADHSPRGKGGFNESYLLIKYSVMSAEEDIHAYFSARPVPNGHHRIFYLLYDVTCCQMSTWIHTNSSAKFILLSWRTLSRGCGIFRFVT